MMDKLNYVLGKLVNSIEGVESDSEMLLRLGIGLAVFIACTIFRNQISKFIVYICTKTLARKSNTVQRSLADSLTKPLSMFVLVLGIYTSTEIVAPTGEIRNGAVLILKLGLIFFVSWAGINLINSDLTDLFNGDDSKSKKTAVAFISNLIKASICIIAVLLVLEQFGISATKIFAALGIGGVAVAFACKDAVENMLSGFIIIFDKPFEVDDCIKIDNKVGTVEDIKIRTTRLRMVDGSEKIYPNMTIANAPIINFSRMEKRSLEETLWLNYAYSGEDVERICAELKEVILTNDSVVPDDVRVNFTSYGEHALEISLFFYVTTVPYAEYQQLKSKINADIKNYVNKNDVQLAFDSQTVYFGNELSVKTK